MKYLSFFVLFIGLLSASCAEDISSTSETDSSTPTSDTTSLATTVEHSDGSRTTTVDATHEDSWVYFDLDTSNTIDDPQAPTWDLAFRRVEILSNGGISGSGNVRVARVNGVSFDDLTTPPPLSDFVQDAADGDDSDPAPDYAFHSPELWYAYDRAAHTITPQDALYVVQTSEGHFVKLQVLGYYDDAGTSGVLSFQWASLDSAQPTTSSIEVDTTASTWTYLSLDPTTTTPSLSDASSWDIAVSSTLLRTNSGSSGDAHGGAKLALTPNPTTTSTVGFFEDTILPIPGPPGSGEDSANPILSVWYDYDRTTHAVTPKDQTYIVRTASGHYASMRILSADHGSFELAFAPVRPVSDTQTVEVYPSEDPAQPWVYLNLRTGEHILDPQEEPWDLAVQSTMIQTNSGSSGQGQGGAAPTDAQTLADVMTLPTVEFAQDTELPIPGPPGSGMFSGNPVLNDWYNYDRQSHSITSKNEVYLVRPANGQGTVKLCVSSYDSSGRMTIQWAYTGPERDAFAP